MKTNFLLLLLLAMVFQLPLNDGWPGPVMSPKPQVGAEIRLALPPLPETESSAYLPADPAPATEELPPAPSSEGPLSDKIDPIIRQKGLQSTQWSVLIADLDRGRLLYSRNSGEALLPASNRKLFTSALALDQLGGDFRFATDVHLIGHQEGGGRFRGDLHLTACGDPTFSARWSKTGRADERFREMGDALTGRGIRHIQGDVIIDISGFDSSERYAPGWDPEQYMAPYSAPTGGFSFNENVVSVVVKPGRSRGAACLVQLLPVKADFQIINTAKTGSKPALSVTRRPGQHIIEVRGSLPLGGRSQQVNLAIANPAAFSGNALVAALKDKGVRIDGILKIRSNKIRLPAPAEKLLTSYSPPLSEILREVNQDSNNFLAEHIYRAVGYYATGQGSYASAHSVEAAFLRRIGVDTAGLQLVDGCGLSRLNQMNANAFVQLLQAMDRHPSGEIFKQSLSVAGQTGTLRRRLADPGLRGNLIGKTGFLKGVSCLSGYLNCPDGSRVALSILMNFPGGAWPQMQAQEAICKAIVRSPLAQ